MAAKKASLTFEDYLRGIQSLEPDDKIDQMDPIDHKGIDTQQYIRKERKSWNQWMNIPKRADRPDGPE